MDLGEGEFFEPLDVSGTNINDIPSNGSMDSLFDEIFKDTVACTHAHTCNLSGPHSSHTHTCYHVHTKLVPSIIGTDDDDKASKDDTSESTEKNGKKGSLGNREAVRKYRQKKKEQAASLEDEVVRLKTLNQRLMKRIKSSGMLEAEVARLKCLLVDVRGRIEGEIGSFRYPIQKGASQNVQNLDLRNGHLVNPCNMLSGDQSYCLHRSFDAETVEGRAAIHDPAFNGCEFGNLQCLGNQNSVLKNISGCGAKDSSLAVNTSTQIKRNCAHATRSR
nr:basic leucine zipper 19-like isoform X2 [Erigeron canadensis]